MIGPDQGSSPEPQPVKSGGLKGRIVGGMQSVASMLTTVQTPVDLSKAIELPPVVASPLPSARLSRVSTPKTDLAKTDLARRRPEALCREPSGRQPVWQSPGLRRVRHFSDSSAHHRGGGRP